MLHRAVSLTAVHLACRQSSAHCLFPLACDHVAAESSAGGARIADANSSGWQMHGFSVDALHQAMTDVRAPLGRQHFIMLACSPSSPHWTHQPAWQTQHSTSLHQPPLPPRFPSATPIHSLTHTHTQTRTQISLHPSVKRYYIRQPSYCQPMDHTLMRPDASSLEI